MPRFDDVEKAKHYQSEVETIEAIEAWFPGVVFHLACVIKYASRAGKKKDPEDEERGLAPGTKDIRKAHWYIRRALWVLEGKPGKRGVHMTLQEWIERTRKDAVDAAAALAFSGTYQAQARWANANGVALAESVDRLSDRLRLCADVLVSLQHVHDPDCCTPTPCGCETQRLIRAALADVEVEP